MQALLGSTSALDQMYGGKHKPLYGQYPRPLYYLQCTAPKIENVTIFRIADSLQNICDENTKTGNAALRRGLVKKNRPFLYNIEGTSEQRAFFEMNSSLVECQSISYKPVVPPCLPHFPNTLNMFYNSMLELGLWPLFSGYFTAWKPTIQTYLPSA